MTEAAERVTAYSFDELEWPHLYLTNAAANAASGAACGRPELEKLMGYLRRDDVLVVARLDRLARSTIALLHIAKRIKQKQARLQSLDEPWADTTSPSGVMIMTVFAGIAQIERSLILKRTD